MWVPLQPGVPEQSRSVHNSVSVMTLLEHTFAVESLGVLYLAALCESGFLKPFNHYHHLDDHPRMRQLR